MKKNTTFIIGVLVILVGGLFAWYAFAPSPLTAFAECLEEKGAAFYGAYWCPACNDQKALFGNAKNKIPYVECSLPNRGGQTSECTAAGIQSYPTWEFADGERVSGVVPLAELSSRTGCALP